VHSSSIRIARVSLAAAGAMERDELKVLASTVGDEERSRADRFVFGADRVRFLIAHAALRRCLADELGCAAGDLRFERGPFGKPRLAFPEAGSLSFSLSHSRSLALIAWRKEAELGIDVEDIDPAVDPVSLAVRVFSVPEQRTLAALSEEARRAAFFDLWTRKEALLKALGTGLTRDPSTVHLGLDAESSAESYLISGRRVFVKRLDVGPARRAALASTSSIEIVNLTDL
jgi:4'-phosphopantetheinyl transferase